MIARVAPHAGAWIETFVNKSYSNPTWSHPMRVRGLKHDNAVDAEPVALSHPMRVRGLKRSSCSFSAKEPESHPMRVRGLKQHITQDCRLR